MNLPLTEKEKKIFLYIRECIKANEYSPTRKEIGDEFGITPQGAQKFINKLVQKGFIRLSKQRKARPTRNIVLK